jgi:septal ring factor EnvC (AmiA/AmiB activator)
MANFLYKNEYIPKPTLTEVARLSITILTNDYMNREDVITQKLKRFMPVINYDKLELELAETKAQLAAERKINSQHEKKIESQRMEIETHTKDLDSVCNTLRKERQEKEELLRSLTESKGGKQADGERSGNNGVYNVTEQRNNPPTESEEPQKSEVAQNHEIESTTKEQDYPKDNEPENTSPFQSLNISIEGHNPMM